MRNVQFAGVRSYAFRNVRLDTGKFPVNMIRLQHDTIIARHSLWTVP